MGSIQRDALREIGNIATGNAATALSQLLNKYIEIKVPDVTSIPIQDFAEYCGGAEQVVVGTYLEITGDLVGEAVFLFPKKSLAGAFLSALHVLTHSIYEVSSVLPIYSWGLSHREIE